MGKIVGTISARAFVSQTESFIEEVTEEVRRDRLFATLKKWGWVAALAVVVLVGGAAFNEYRKAESAAAAQEFGDQLMAGILAEDGGSVLAQVDTDGPTQAVVAANLAAASALNNGDRERALRELEDAKVLIEAPAIYRDLSAFKYALALPRDTNIDERMSAFEALTAPGGPFRLLAQEQTALIMIEKGDVNGILQDSELTAGLQRRASELIVALGGELAES
jgi:hypothetical protein